MVDIRVLSASGYTTEKLRQLFCPDGGASARKDKIVKLLELTSGRIREGVNRQLKHARHWWMIDQACDVSNRSMGATALRGLRSQNPDPKAMIRTMQDWGLTAFLNPTFDEQGNPKVDAGGRILYKIDDAPITEIIAPICQQYLFARWATLVTGRDQSPWLKYSPLVYSRKSHLQTSIFTSRAEQMVADMGYRADFSQEALCALKYGYQFVFAREPYYYEKQQHMTEHGTRERVVKEGIRTSLPHPSRTFFDLSYRMSTLNTNTGVAYAGYWDIYRWGDVLSNQDFWLTKEQREGRFGYGVGLGIEASAWTEYSQLYPTMMNFPQQIYHNESRSDLDRTAESNRIVYNAGDQGVVLTPIFQKLNPKEWGLFDYDGDVWFCFTMANGDTPVLVEPYGYTPVRVTQYQGDQSHWRPTSMVTDLVPFQDSIGNLLTQYLMSVRRNLMNIIYYNKDSVSKEVIDHLMGQASGLWIGPNLVPVSFKNAQLDSTTSQISDQFKAVTFPMSDTVAVVGAINTMLGIIERVIGFTAQEVGTTGSHVQSAQEIKVVTDFANNRIALTDSFFDQSIGAQKVQIYEAVMNYGDDLVFGEVSDLSDVDKQILDEMGVAIEEGEGRKTGVMADKTALSVNAFASDREGSRRTDDSQIATALMQFAQTVFSVPQIAEAVGVDGIVEVFNSVAQFSGLGPEAKLRLPNAKKLIPAAAAAQGGGAPGQEQGVPQLPPGAQPGQPGPAGAPPGGADPVSQIMQQVQEMVNSQMQEVGQGIRTEVVEPMQQMAAKHAEMEQALMALMQAVQAIRGQQGPPMALPPMPPQQMPIPQMA